MKASEVLERRDFKRCEKFHGHVCPGLSIGYRAGRIGLERLSEQRAEDEEMVAIIETDACCADAIQVLTGCTFGKGNFIYRDNGKMVFTFFSRNSGKGVRISLRPDAFKPGKEHSALLEKVMAGEATHDMMQRFRELHHQRSCEVLEMPAERLFAVSEVTLPAPPKARMEPSMPCAQCGEPTMPSKMVEISGLKKCRDCAGR